MHCYTLSTSIRSSATDLTGGVSAGKASRLLGYCAHIMQCHSSSRLIQMYTNTISHAKKQLIKPAAKRWGGLFLVSVMCIYKTCFRPCKLHAFSAYNNAPEYASEYAISRRQIEIFSGEGALPGVEGKPLLTPPHTYLPRRLRRFDPRVSQIRHRVSVRLLSTYIGRFRSLASPICQPLL